MEGKCDTSEVVGNADEEDKTSEKERPDIGKENRDKEPPSSDITMEKAGNIDEGKCSSDEQQAGQDIEMPQPYSNSAYFYLKLHELITDFKMSKEEMYDIQVSVEEIVRHFADVVANIEPMFKAQSIHGVGSFYEGTKILKLDEFDFLYVIDELSNGTYLQMTKVLEEDILGVAVKLNDVEHFKDSKWLLDKDENGDAYLGIFNFLPPKAVIYVENRQESFSDVLTRAAESFRKEPLKSRKSTGLLSLMGQETKAGPNVELWFEWQSVRGESIVLKADITPVIRATNLTDIVSEIECDYIPHLTKLHCTGSYLVMPSKFRHMQIPNTFSPTFTETERDLMKDLNLSHRIVYQCLKFLLLDIYTRRNPLFWDLRTFLLPSVYPDVDIKDILNKLDYLTHKSFLSSYCLKTAVLQHTRSCQHPENLDLCSKDVVNTLLGCVCRQHPTLPSTFVKQDNLFFKLSQTDHRKDRELLITVLTMLKTFHEKLSEIDVADDELPSAKFRKAFTLLLQLSDDCGLQEYYTIMEFHPGKFSMGLVYGAYKFTKETESILEDNEMDQSKKRFLLREASTLYNFDYPSMHSTIADKALEDNLDTIKQKIANYEPTIMSTENEDNDGRQPEDTDTDDSPNVTVIYSRI